MTVVQHAACGQCVHCPRWPDGHPCITCYWNGGLTNAFEPAKPQKKPKKRERKPVAATPAATATQQRRKRQRDGRRAA